jgi:hypothetical protein
MTTDIQILARAVALHETRNANHQRHGGRARAFDGAERAFCIAEATHLVEDERHAAAEEARTAAHLAAMTDDDLDRAIALVDFEAEGRYPRMVLYGLRKERRLYVGEQLRRSVAAGSQPTVDTVAAFVINDIFNRYADSLREASGEEQSSMEAAQ